MKLAKNVGRPSAVGGGWAAGALAGRALRGGMAKEDGFEDGEREIRDRRALSCPRTSQRASGRFQRCHASLRSPEPSRVLDHCCERPLRPSAVGLNEPRPPDPAIERLVSAPPLPSPPSSPQTSADPAPLSSQPISEQQVKELCLKAREILVEEANVQWIDSPVTVRRPFPLLDRAKERALSGRGCRYAVTSTASSGTSSSSSKSGECAQTQTTSSSVRALPSLASQASCADALATRGQGTTSTAGSTASRPSSSSSPSKSGTRTASRSSAGTTSRARSRRCTGSTTSA